MVWTKEHTTTSSRCGPSIINIRGPISMAKYLQSERKTSESRLHGKTEVQSTTGMITKNPFD